MNNIIRESIKKEVDDLKEISRRLSRGPEIFQVFDFHREHIYSSILALLINRNLKKMQEELGWESISGAEMEVDFTNRNVLIKDKRKKDEKGGRLDILIEGKNKESEPVFLAIECKVGSKTSEGQLTKYNKGLCRVASEGEKYLVCLSKADEKEQKALCIKHGWKILTYSAFIKKFKLKAQGEKETLIHKILAEFIRGV